MLDVNKSDDVSKKPLMSGARPTRIEQYRRDKLLERERDKAISLASRIRERFTEPLKRADFAPRSNERLSAHN